MANPEIAFGVRLIVLIHSRYDGGCTLQRHKDMYCYTYQPFEPVHPWTLHKLIPLKDDRYTIQYN